MWDNAPYGKSMMRTTSKSPHTAPICKPPAPAEAYQKDGLFKHEMGEYLTGFETTATLCSLDYQGAMWLNGVSYVRRGEAKTKQQQAAAQDYAAKLAEKIKAVAAA